MAYVPIKGEYKHSFVLYYTFSCITDNIYTFIFAVQTSTPGCCQKRLEVSLAREENVTGSAFHPVLPGQPTAGWLWAQLGRRQKRCLCPCVPWSLQSLLEISLSL